MLNFHQKLILLLLLLPLYMTAQHWGANSQVFGEVTGMYPVKNSKGKKYLQNKRSNTLATPFKQDTLRTSKTVSFDFTLTDTSQYENRFNMIGEIPIYGRTANVHLFDTNKNGRDEIVGVFWDSDAPLTGVTRYYELNDQGNAFDLVYDFGTELINAGGVQQLGGDLDSDNWPELYLKYGNILRVYESNDSSYAVHLQQTLSPVLPVYPSGYFSGDFDQDGHKELVYLRNNTAANTTAAVFREYSPQDSSLVISNEVVYPGDSGAGTFAAGDFDGDGHIEFFKTNVFGDIFGIENVENDSFAIHFLGNTEITNGHYNLGTGDLDGDGKLECYLGGRYNGPGPIVNRIVVVEATGDDSYEASHYLEISPGSGFYFQKIATGDVDGDGQKELILDTGGWVSIFKVTGDDSYELFWLKRVPSPDAIGVGDVDGDGTDEIVIAQDIFENNRSYSRSRIYKFDPTSVGIESESPNLPMQIKLAQNYPNPFNPSTQIKFSLPKSDKVTLSVFNVRGQLVETLVDETLQAGEHAVRWNGEDMSSGIYFYRLQTGGQSAVKKMMLLQ